MEPRDVQPGHFYRSLVIADRRWPYRPDPCHWAIVRVETRCATGGWVVTDLGLNEKLFILSPDLFLEEVPAEAFLERPATGKHVVTVRSREDQSGVPRWLLWVLGVLAALCALGVYGWILLMSPKITW